MVEDTAHDERALLLDALGVPSERVTFAGREPLGPGSVTSFDVCEHAGAVPLRYCVDTSGSPVAHETGLVLGNPVAPEVRIWLHPADPYLPGLAPVAFHGAATALLTRLEVHSEGEPVFVAYRPGRRAVLRVDAQGRRVWVKIVRPSRAARIASRHAAAEEAGLPVPALLGWSPDGVLIIEDAVGSPAVDAVGAGSGGAHAELLGRVDALRSRIAGVSSSEPTTGIAARLDWYASRLTALPEAVRLAEDVREVLGSRRSARPQRVVHGDLHLGQLFLVDGKISAVIDIDTLGVGDPAEDPAAFMAHAVMSALLTENASGRPMSDFADAAMARWGDDPVVRAFFAVHMLGHALATRDSGRVELTEASLAIGAAVLAGGPPAADAKRFAIAEARARAER
ncbi:MAG: aminoglycoside phosphotransferase family protein [Leucobacter sp.]